MRFYTGSYNQKNSPAQNPTGDGIGICHLDAITGEITVDAYQTHRNPSYLCISKNNEYLYAVEELPEGNGARVFSYEICIDNRLKQIDTKEIPGGYACHLAICASQLVIVNYMSGDALSFNILEGGYLSDHYQVIQNYGNGPNKLRQESPHMHMVYPWEKNKLFIVDLCLDNAQGYVFNRRSGKWEKEEYVNLNIDPGAGARHMVMSNDKSLAFVLGELTSEIFVFRKNNRSFGLVQKISFMNDYSLMPSGAAIKIHPDGKYLYASDRTSNQIAIFKIDRSKQNLSLMEFVDTGGKCPRDFSFDPSGNWLIVANQDSNNLVVFRVNKENGLLVRHSIANVKTPVNVCFQHSISS